MIHFPITGDWQGCYGQSWKGLITDESFKHPAKFSRNLIHRIYQYLIDENLVSQGDTILDPFGGVALGALPALRLGLNWQGVELEQNFVELGRENIALWESHYRGKLPMWTGQAVLTQGDSRRLLEILQGDFAAILTSSPFAGNSGGRGQASREGIDPALFDRHQGAMVGGIGDRESGNLASMPQTDFEAVVSSPPYENGCTHTGGKDPKPGYIQGGELRYVDYGQDERQLGAMKAGELSGVVSSPPYENSVNQSAGANDTEARIERMKQAGIDISHKPNVGGPNGTYSQPQVYGDSDGQIGATSGDTFWSAARLILEQCHQALAPDGVAVFVAKDFVKKGERVPFADQWVQLCIAIGFVPYAHFRAWQIKPGPVQTALVGDDVDCTKEYKSFFRRNSEKKGAPRIDWESVLIFKKAATERRKG